MLREGLRKREKTTHELLLKCVIIITSVVPRQFPMQASPYPTLPYPIPYPIVIYDCLQMAMAVNMALMSLSKVF